MSLSRETICEKLIVETIDLILDARGFDGQILLLPQRELTARDLLRNGVVPVEVIRHLLARADAWLLCATNMLAEELRDRHIEALKRELA